MAFLDGTQNAEPNEIEFVYLESKIKKIINSF